MLKMFIIKFQGKGGVIKEKSKKEEIVQNAKEEAPGREGSREKREVVEGTRKKYSSPKASEKGHFRGENGQLCRILLKSQITLK